MSNLAPVWHMTHKRIVSGQQKLMKFLNPNYLLKIMMAQRRNFSPQEYEYWLNYLLQRDGYLCVHCNKDVATLIRESKSERKLPVLVIDHIDGDTRFTDSRTGVHGGNLRCLCYSCNRKNTRQTRPVLPTRDRSPEQQKSEDAKPMFYNWLNAYLREYRHICFKMMLNRGSKLALDSSQVTAERWYDQMVDAINGYEEFALFHTGIDCPYSKCNGTHVCFYGETPRPKSEEPYTEMAHNEADYNPDEDFR